MSECQTKAGNQVCYEKLSLLSLFHLFYLDMLNNFCFHVYAQKSLSHTFTTFATFTTFTLSFTLSRHAEQFLFSCLCSKLTVYSRKLQGIFWDHLLLVITLSPDIRVHRAGSQLKKCLNVRQKLAGNQEVCKTCKTFAKLVAKLALSHSLTLDMLNNFYFHVYAQKLLSHSLIHWH